MQRPQMNPKVSISIVFVAAMFMSIMDGTIVNVALPSIGHQFGISSTSVDTIVVSYLVSLAVVIPVSGWLGDRLGTRRIFLGALCLFTLASALCGLANSLGMLIAFRVLQGIAGGALTPVGNTMLMRTFPPAERVQLSRILNIPTVIAPATGPVLGGLLVDKLSWHWVFYVNLPIGIATLLFGLIFLSEQHERSSRGFDFPGFLFAGIGLALFMYALSEGSNYGWITPAILSSLIAGGVLIAVFVFCELSTREPMIDLHLLRNRQFRNCNLVTVLSGAGFLGLLYTAPLFLQEGRGVSAITSGLTTFPEAIGVVVGFQIGSRIYPVIGPRRLMAGGIIMAAIMMTLLCLMGSTTSLWLMRALMFLTGASMAQVFLSTSTAAYANITASEAGHASALYGTVQQIGSALGVAILSTVLSSIGIMQLIAGKLQPNLTAYHIAFLTAAVLTLLAVIFALNIRDKDAAATMQRTSNTRDTLGGEVSAPVEIV
ncbi:MDR family MFS transporter [Dictyobacter arantiisoli]|uniref:MFS transporter n=1 Tax=Dictyobacter arantiisoli TaxID=2014874 RepID=A0A5A5TGF4_9CHLR|nr:MDR family MFS transporter [Dictyobacter arantiisoli]GCF10447.1 MFS transporter [Dictyobacter arantiisoli]